MNPSTEETVEIKAGNYSLNAPFTRDGLKLVGGMLKLLEGVVEGHPFSPPKSSSKQRIKFKEWKAVANTKGGVIYKEVINRMLEEYKDGVAPATEILSQIIQEMYGKHLKKDSIATYISIYKRYIRENKLAVEPSAEELKAEEDVEDPIVKPHQKRFIPKGKEIIPMDKVVEIWELLPDEFEYKRVKSLVPVHIAQTAPRIDATNYIVKQFLDKDNPAFGCVETSAGVFVKTEK